MGYFLEATKRGSAPHIHPLLLSLSEVYTESDESPKINTIAEDDPKALRSNYYTPPSELRRWIYMSLAKMVRLHSDTYGSPLTLAASCQACTEPMALEHHDSSAEEGGAMINMPRKGKKCWRASSSVDHRESFIFMALSR
jgi:hypothetical protein